MVLRGRDVKESEEYTEAAFSLDVSQGFDCAWFFWFGRGEGFDGVVFRANVVVLGVLGAL